MTCAHVHVHVNCHVDQSIWRSASHRSGRVLVAAMRMALGYFPYRSLLGKTRPVPFRLTIAWSEQVSRISTDIGEKVQSCLKVNGEGGAPDKEWGGHLSVHLTGRQTRRDIARPSAKSSRLLFGAPKQS